MWIDSLAAALAREHREGGVITAFIADRGSFDRQRLERSVGALRRHNHSEEFLFPLLRAAGFEVPALPMLREGGRIWKAQERELEPEQVPAGRTCAKART